MKTVSKIILATYILAEIILLSYSGVYFLVLKEITDYEMFAFNFYGSLLLFGSSCLMALLLRFIFKISNKIILGVLLFILPNIVGWFMTGDSLYMSAFKGDTSYLIMYPVSILVAFVTLIIYSKYKIDNVS